MRSATTPNVRVGPEGEEEGLGDPEDGPPKVGAGVGRGDDPFVQAERATANSSASAAEGRRAGLGQAEPTGEREYETSARTAG